MNWIAYSLMMFVSSVGLYLLVRKASLQKVPTHLVNLAMFGIPLLGYITLGFGGHQTYSLSALNWLVIVVAAIVFAYGGNVASLVAISSAPNPGYSLVLSKSYVLFTTLVAVAFLGAELNLRKLLAILMIVGFSILIMVNRKNAKHVAGNSWVALSLAAFLRP